MSHLRLRFLTRPGCHICDDARPLVMDEAGRVGAIVEEIDVDSDDRLLGSYGMRIPVLLGPGDEVFAEGIINERRALRKALRRL